MAGHPIPNMCSASLPATRPMWAVTAHFFQPPRVALEAGSLAVRGRGAFCSDRAGDENTRRDGFVGRSRGVWIF
jgi:hypothetical protein